MRPFTWKIEIRPDADRAYLTIECGTKEAPCRVPLRKVIPIEQETTGSQWNWNGVSEPSGVCIHPSIWCKQEGCGLHFSIVDGGKVLEHP